MVNETMAGRKKRVRRARRIQSKSTYLSEDANRTARPTSRSSYVKELFKSSEKAVDDLIVSRRGRVNRLGQ